jgi:phage baseplate assembly protein V
MSGADNLRRGVDRVYRRVQMLFAPVKILATDDSGPVHRVQVRATGPETIDNVPVLQIYGLASHAPVGSDAACLFVAGDRSNSVIVATGKQADRLRDLKSGEVALYTAAGTFIKLSGNDVYMNVAGKVRIDTPRLEVTGDIIDHCDSQPHTDADMRQIYNTHTHGGVTFGTSHTAIPDQLQRVVEDDA